MGLYVLMGFTYNILTSMLPPLVMILAIADDVHIVQHFNAGSARDGQQGTRVQVDRSRTCSRRCSAPARTTALGLASLATSNVVAVRAFGVGAAVGVMVDFVMSLVLVPTLLMLITPR